MGWGGRWSSGLGGKGEENTIILGQGVTKCSVQESFVIKIVYTVKSEFCFFLKLFLGNLSILTCET